MAAENPDLSEAPAAEGRRHTRNKPAHLMLDLGIYFLSASIFLSVKRVSTIFLFHKNTVKLGEHSENTLEDLEE